MEAVVALMLDRLYGFSQNVPLFWLWVVLVAALTSLCLLYQREIRDCLSPTGRIHRKVLAKALANKDRQDREFIRSARMQLAGPITFTPAKGKQGMKASAPLILPQHRLARYVRRYANWLRKHHLLPETLFFWIGRRLGYWWKRA